jgi:hypothetical protein
MAYSSKKQNTGNSMQGFGATRAPRGPGQIRSGAQPVTEEETSTNKQRFGSKRAPRRSHTVGTGKKTGGYKVRNNKYNVGK